MFDDAMHSKTWPQFAPALGPFSGKILAVSALNQDGTSRLSVVSRSASDTR
jgi:hypothetical protein